MNICAIDPGLSGGIAFQTTNGMVMTFNMPKTPTEMWGFFDTLKEDYGNYVIFLEKVQMWGSDLDSPGKAFQIQKMTANYKSMYDMLVVQKHPIIEVHPRTWQNELGLYFKNTDKQTRKNKYKRFASKTYPNIKPTLKTADALCILSYGRLMVGTKPNEVKNSISNKETLLLFK